MYDKTLFIKISNNKNNKKDFYIDITTMKDPRIRMSSLKTQYKKYLKTGELFKPIFHYFKIDYSFYTIDKGSFSNYQEVKEHRNKLYKEQFIKMNDSDRGFKSFLKSRV